MSAPRYHPSAEQIVPGVLVSHRNDGPDWCGDWTKVIGQVDSVSGDVVMVSWPAAGHAAAPTDERGRRGQAFTRNALMISPSSGPASLVAFGTWRCGGTMVATGLHHVPGRCPEHGAELLAAPEWTERGIAVLGVEHGTGR